MTDEMEQFKNMAKQILSKSIDELPLRIKTILVLKNNDIFCINDLVQKTHRQLLKINGFGKTSLEEVEKVLLYYNLFLTIENNQKEELNETTKTTIKTAHQKPQFETITYGTPTLFSEAVTLHDQFAMAALQGILAYSGPSCYDAIIENAEMSYRYADAMKKARNG